GKFREPEKNIFNTTPHYGWVYNVVSRDTTLDGYLRVGERVGRASLPHAWFGEGNLEFFDKRYAPGPVPVALSPDKSFLVAAEPDTESIRDDITGNLREVSREVRGGLLGPDHLPRPYKSPAGNVRALGVSPDGKRIAAGHRDGLVTLWDAASGAVL